MNFKIVRTVDVNLDPTKFWPTKKLGDIATAIVPGDELTAKQMLTPGTYPCIRNQDVGKLDACFTQCISKVSPDVLKRSINVISKGVVIMSDMGTEKGLGKACAFMGSGQPIIGSSVIGIVHDENPIFLAFMINSPFVKNQVLRKMKGTLVQHLRSGDLKNLDIPLPDRKEQDKVAELILKIQKNEECMCKVTKEMTVLFGNMYRKALKQ